MRFRSIAPTFAVGVVLALASTSPTYAFGGHGGGGGGGGFHGGGGGGFHGAGGGGFHGGGFRGAGVAPRAGGIQVGRSIGYNGQSHVRAFGGAPSGTYHIGTGGFRHGYGRGFGYGVGGLAFGYGLGYGNGYGYDDPGYADYTDADPAYGYAQPDASYVVGPQYSQDQGYDVQTVRTGRSAATIGQSCATPVKVCTLYNQSYVGGPCSCKVPGGRAHGRVSP